MNGFSNPAVLVGALLGPLVVVAALVHLAVGSARRRGRVRVEGEVLRYEHSLRTSNPVVRFVTREGREVTGRVTAVDLGIYTARSVPVWYDPRDPTRFSAQVSPLGWPGCVLIVVAVPLLVVSWFAVQFAMTSR